MPLRTSDRGAGTRQAPCRQASHISSHEASNATDSPASTRSPGPIGLSCRNICASASTNAAALRCVTATPLGVPVDPEVKMIQASSRVSGAPARQPREEPGPRAMPASVTTATTSASPNTNSARSSGSSASTGTYAAPGGQRREDRHVQREAAGRHPDADPVAATDATRGQPRDAGFDVADQLAVGELHRAVVDRRGFRDSARRCRRGCR